MVGRPRGNSIASHCCLWKWSQPGNKLIHSKLSYICKKARTASQVVLSRLQLKFHSTHQTLHGASRLLQAMSAWSVKTRRAPPRHCTDARVYIKTTFMHEMSTPPPLLWPLSLGTRSPLVHGFRPCSRTISDNSFLLNLTPVPFEYCASQKQTKRR